MKKLVLLSFLVFSIIILGCEKIIENVENKIQITDKKLKDDIVKGGYKECTVYYTNYTYNNGRLVNKAKGKWHSIKYDEKGNILEDQYFNVEQDSLIGMGYTYKYNDKNDIIEENIYDSNNRIFIKYINNYDYRDSLKERVSIHYDNHDKGKPTIKYSTFYKYDYKGNKIEESSYHDDILSHKINYKFDNKNNKIEELEYDNKQNIIEQKIYKYNTMGKVIEEDYFGYNRNYNGKRVYKYKENGKKIESIVCSPSGFIYIRYIRTFDLNGYNDIEIKYKTTVSDIDPRIRDEIKYQIRYNINGDKIEEINDYEKILYFYNKKYNLIQELKYHPIDKIEYTKNYKYDNYDNLIEEIEYDKYNQFRYKIEYIYSK